MSSPDDLVRRTVRAIEARQRPDGSYVYWEGGTCADPWSSAYTVWSLGRADDAGYPVDRAALQRAKGWLAGTVLAGELSLAAAISSLEWVSAHERYGRHR